MSLKHANIAIFVPHIGCPNTCSFCNQNHITGCTNTPDETDIDEAVIKAVNTPKYNAKTTEIAFFGGSFTAIERQYMVSLLKAANKYIKNGTVNGIRVSTRPDAIDDEVLNILKEYGVTAIELGAQSMCDSVLIANNRGHSSLDTVKAANLIKDFGFELGLQMMTGLYTDTPEKTYETAIKIAELKPKTVRIYPTLVLKDTCLENLFLSGKYVPQNLEDAVIVAANLYEFFTEHGINVIRLGLHTIEENSFVAGPWHPAFSELCLSKILLEKILKQATKKGNYTVYVNKSDVSKAIGQKKSNINYLKENGFNVSVKTNDSLKPMQILVEKEV